MAVALHYLIMHIMTTIFAAILTIAIIIAVSLIAVSLHYYRKQVESERLPASFKSAARAFNLSIAKQEVMGNRVIGIDDSNNKLLFLEARGDKKDGYLIGLDELRRCSVKREYGAIHAGSLNGSSLESYVNKIVLKLDYRKSAQPTVLPFYERATNPESEMRERAEQATAWQALLSAAIIKSNNPPVRYKESPIEIGAMPDFVF